MRGMLINQVPEPAGVVAPRVDTVAPFSTTTSSTSTPYTFWMETPALLASFRTAFRLS